MPDRARRCALAVLAAVIIAACGAGPERRPDLVKIIATASPAVVAIGDSQTVAGSGFRLRASGLIATAAHVLAALKGPPEVRWNGHRLAARVVIVDADTDVGFVALEDQAPIPDLELANAEPPPGTWIVVLGCPFGASATATTGIVSANPGAVLEPASLRTRIQLNAAVNPGNSGGPVLDLAGRVIGIANATIPGGFGLGFAIPTEAVRAVLQDASRQH